MWPNTSKKVLATDKWQTRNMKLFWNVSILWNRHFILGWRASPLVDTTKTHTRLSLLLLCPPQLPKITFCEKWNWTMMMNVENKRRPTDVTQHHAIAHKKDVPQFQILKCFLYARICVPPFKFPWPFFPPLFNIFWKVALPKKKTFVLDFSWRTSFFLRCEKRFQSPTLPFPHSAFASSRSELFSRTKTWENADRWDWE